MIEEMKKRTVKTIVVLKITFSTPLLVEYASILKPKALPNPPLLVCKRIRTIRVTLKRI